MLEGHSGTYVELSDRCLALHRGPQLSRSQRGTIIVLNLESWGEATYMYRWCMQRSGCPNNNSTQRCSATLIRSPNQPQPMMTTNKQCSRHGAVPMAHCMASVGGGWGLNTVTTTWGAGTTCALRIGVLRPRITCAYYQPHTKTQRLNTVTTTWGAGTEYSDYNVGCRPLSGRGRDALNHALA
jgi:hypothetical protein